MKKKRKIILDQVEGEIYFYFTMIPFPISISFALILANPVLVN